MSTFTVDLDLNDLWIELSSYVYDTVDERAWDAVQYQVEEAATEAAGGEAHTEEQLQDLLDQFIKRMENGTGLCALGTSAKRAITMVAEQVNVASTNGRDRVLSDRLDKVETLLANFGAHIGIAIPGNEQAGEPF